MNMPGTGRGMERAQYGASACAAANHHLLMPLGISGHLRNPETLGMVTRIGPKFEKKRRRGMHLGWQPQVLHAYLPR